MAYKTLIFGINNLFEKSFPYLVREIQRGTLEITNYAVMENEEVAIFDATGKVGEEQLFGIDLAIVFSQNDFYRCMKFLEEQGISRHRIIDGRVFQIPNLDFKRLLGEGIAYGFLDDASYFFDITNLTYPRVYFSKNSEITIKLGIKSRINKSHNLPARLEFFGKNNVISIGNFCGISWNQLFELGLNENHNRLSCTSYSLSNLDWTSPENFYSQNGNCEILIGNDVWCGRGSILKSTNPNKPLVIGDGAVIASDSVVVKNVPPYAIVGGNPAKIIKFRFSEDVIEALLRIKWWDWDIDKIHDNFKYFNDIEKFISLHDK